jgi:hypothetical protein
MEFNIIFDYVKSHLYSRGMHPVARVIKLQHKTLIRNNRQMCLFSVLLDHITTCFGLYMWPSSGDFRDIKYKK